MNKCMLNFIACLLAISLATCSNQGNDKPNTHETVSENSPNLSQNPNSSKNDSLIIGKVELAKIYAQAIAAYIGAVQKKDQTHFDTLFFGKRPDFPDIDLPTTIGGTTIQVLAPEEIDRKKPLYRTSSPYINSIGFMENNRAAFIFVTFYPDFKHQYDCYIDFKYNPETKAFDLDKLRIEVLVPGKDGKPQHFAVYEDGQYVGDKPIVEKHK